MREKEMIFKPIMLKDILPIEDLSGYRIATPIGNPVEYLLEWLDEMEAGTPNEDTIWYQWQTYSSDDRNDYKDGALVLFLAQMSNEKSDTYLFSGIYKATLLPKGERRTHDHVGRTKNFPYHSELTPQGASLIGRLKVKIPHVHRNKRVKLHTYYDSIEVVEVLPEIYKLP